MSPKLVQSRLEWIDSAKEIAIILVVIGYLCKKLVWQKFYFSTYFICCDIT